MRHCKLKPDGELRGKQLGTNPTIDLSARGIVYGMGFPTWTKLGEAPIDGLTPWASPKKVGVGGRGQGG